MILGLTEGPKYFAKKKGRVLLPSTTACSFSQGTRTWYLTLIVLENFNYNNVKCHQAITGRNFFYKHNNALWECNCLCFRCKKDMPCPRRVWCRYCCSHLFFRYSNHTNGKFRWSRRRIISLQSPLLIQSKHCIEFRLYLLHYTEIPSI
jgi:hypothetical protein